MNATVDISIVVVSWNSRGYLPECLASVAPGARARSFEIVVVDNASRDGSAALVRERFPQVRLIENSENRGFAAANNQALMLARGRYLMLLNPDTRVHEGALDLLVSFMDARPSAGACGPLLLNADGSVQHTARRFPTFAFAFGARTVLGRLGMFRGSGRSVKMRGAAFDDVTEVDQPSGAALFLRRGALERVGLLDERFFMFFEEVDLCRRNKEAGYEIYLVPRARVTHYGGRSRRQNRARVIRPAAESLIRYFRKHEGPVRTGLFEVAFRPLFALGICADAARAGGRALVAGLRGDERAAEKAEVFRAYAAFIKRDLIPFLVQMWE